MPMVENKNLVKIFPEQKPKKKIKIS